MAKTNLRQIRDHAALNSSQDQKNRFWSKCQQVDDCLLYPAKPTHYGLYCVNNSQMGAHRYALLVSKGLPSTHELLALHSCRNRNCVSPAHLRWGTHAENKADNKKDGTHLRPSQRGSLNNNAYITDELALEIWKSYASDTMSRRQVAKLHNVSANLVNHIVGRKRWTHVTAQLPDLSPELIMRHRYGERCASSKLKSSDVIQMMDLLREGRMPQKDIALKYGVSRAWVTNLKQGKTWRHLTQGIAVADKKLREVRKKERIYPKLQAKDVAKIRKLLRIGKMTQKEIGDIFGVSDSLISNIKLGLSYGAVG